MANRKLISLADRKPINFGVTREKEIRELKKHLSEKNTVINNLKRKLFEERFCNTREKNELEKETEDERLRNMALKRKLREAKTRDKEAREYIDEIRQALDSLIGMGPDDHDEDRRCILMNDLHWMSQTGNMHLISHARRMKIRKWIFEAKKLMDEDSDFSATGTADSAAGDSSS